MRLDRKLLGSLLLACGLLAAADRVERPFQGIVHIARTETEPRSLRIHIVTVDLAAPGIRFKLTSPSGSRETVRQTTLDFLKQEQAQVAVNAHFFIPFPSTDTEVNLIGFAASMGKVFSSFENPEQSYAIVPRAPALNIDPSNRAAIVHYDPAFEDGRHLIESVVVGNAVAGSAQIVTNGERTVPHYSGPENLLALLTPGGPNHYSNAKSWYDVLQARTAIGLSRDGRTLYLFTVDVRAGSSGMSLPEAADLLIREGAYQALNLDGGGSTTLALEDPATHSRSIVNISSDNPAGRSVGSSLAVFASPAVQ
jgi:exopolysaccharide biosynthesis protein